MVLNGSRLLEAFYNLAGESFHAERLRTTKARSSVRPVAPDVTPPDPADPSSEDGPPTGEEPPAEEASSLAVDGETPESASP